jgi:hypothetical protein
MAASITGSARRSRRVTRRRSLPGAISGANFGTPQALPCSSECSTVDAKTRTTLRRLVDDRRRQELLERGYRKTAESLSSSCYDTAAGDPLLALWYAIVWTMIEQGSLPGSRPLRFKRAPARVVDARNENHDRDADAERRELLRSLQPA